MRVNCALPEIFEVCHTWKRARNGKITHLWEELGSG